MPLTERPYEESRLDARTALSYVVRLCIDADAADWCRATSLTMDAVAVSLPRQPDGMTAATVTMDASPTLPASATYLLSEEGRKASLLAGGDGRAMQELTVHVPANRLHLVSVDANGVARLKLQPRYHLDDPRGIVRIDAPPTYDAPPDVEELFRDAARNHQLERAYHAERHSVILARVPRPLPEASSSSDPRPRVAVLTRRRTFPSP